MWFGERTVGQISRAFASCVSKPEHTRQEAGGTYVCKFVIDDLDVSGVAHQLTPSYRGGRREAGRVGFPDDLLAACIAAPPGISVEGLRTRWYPSVWDDDAASNFWCAIFFGMLL